jgi:hypothetical protein
MRLPPALLAMLLCAACSGSSSGKPDGGGGGDDGGGGGGSDADTSCSIAPDPVCVDGTRLLSSRAPGTFSDGRCEFATISSPCVFGCANGACQPQACTPTCPTAICTDDGCGGTCGPCASGTTFPGATATSLGIADDVKLAPDGIHLAAIRALQPLSAACGSYNPPKVGTLDLWTLPAAGAPTHRIVGAHVPLYSVTFTDDGNMLYNDNADPCTGRGELWMARADGTQPRRILADASIGVTLAGGRVFYTVRDPADPTPNDFDGFLYAVRLPDGAPVKLASIRYNSRWEIAPSGAALWVNYNQTLGDLKLIRLDGTSTQLDTTDAVFGGYPAWSPDGSKLAFVLVDRTPKVSLHLIGADGSGRVMLDDDCVCNYFDSIAWSADGARIAWLQRPPTFGLDAVVHTLAGGPDVVLTGAVSPTTGGSVFRFTFSNGGKRLYAAAGSDQNGWKLMSGDVTTPGAMTAIVPALSPDGDRFQLAWTESPDGAVLAARSADSTTKVITFGVGTQSVAGAAFEQPRLEPVAASPRWLLQTSSTALSVFPTSGAGAGTPLPGFQWSSELSSWAFSRDVPFAFGWSGSTALYPSNLAGTFYTKVTQDLMAWTPAAAGRLGALVTHYRLGDAPARVYFTTSAGALFWVARP